ncbi:MAG: hypothetical protein AAF961_17315 [Planctomycetota bacterium]
MTTTDFSIENRGDFLHARLGPNFEMTPTSMERHWAELADICRQSGCRRVLVEGHVSHRDMTQTAAFDTGEWLSRAIPGLSLACCVTGFEPDQVTMLFRDVAHNRGAEVELFPTVEEAIQWLRSVATGPRAHDLSRGEM